mgnify:CR=1 FL=1
MAEIKNVLKKLLIVQQNISVPKGQRNEFGKFNYRSCEDILEQARPLCNDNGLVIKLTDKIVNIENRFYVEATASVIDVDSGEVFFTTAYAREADEKRGMDSSQVTGASSSYARKYALAGLFSLDDNKDADTMDNTSQEDKDKVLKSICRTIRANKIDNGLVTKIIENKYRKFNSKQLTLSELKDLDKNILNYVSQY